LYLLPLLGPCPTTVSPPPSSGCQACIVGRGWGLGRLRQYKCRVRHIRPRCAHHSVSP